MQDGLRINIAWRIAVVLFAVLVALMLVA